MKAIIKTETKRFICCPSCGGNGSTVDHIFEGQIKQFGPWYCDNCGCSYSGKLINGEIEIEINEGRRKDDCLVYLRNGNVLLVVKGMYFDGEFEEKSYFYDEYTCPTNYMKNVEKVIDLADNDTDPHGIFEYIGISKYVDLDEVEDITKFIQDEIIEKEPT